jgi:hypothetical protein
MWMLWLWGVGWAQPPLTGSWVIEEPAAVVQARVDAAIATAASQFGVFSGVATRRLKPSAIWCQRYRFDLSDGVTYQCDDRDPIVTPAGQLGATRTLDLPAGPTEATISLAGELLTARFGRDDGGRLNRFAVVQDRVVLSVEVFSPQLSTPMRYEIRYVRAP